MNAAAPGHQTRRRGWRYRWRRLPVRWRLTAWYAAFLGAALVVFSAAVFIGLRFNFYVALDEQVEDQTALTLANIQQQGGDLTFVPGEIGDLESDEHFIRLLTVEGGIVADTSAALGGVPLDQEVIQAALDGDTRLTSAHSRGETFRVITVPVMVAGEIRGVLQVGLSREEIDEALRALVLLLIAFGPLVLAIAVAGGYVLAGRAMAPVGEITRLAGAIDADDLSARLDLELPDDELGRLAVTFDAMLNRIEEAYARQRRFTGDAAHELRTPLSLMRSQVDLALLRSRSAEEYRAALSILQEDLERLGTLVSSLLALARADAGQLALSLTQCDLADLVEVVVEQFSAQAAEAGVALRRETPSCSLVADEDLLVQVLVNLIANALAHTPEGGTVTVSCRRQDAEVGLWVADTGVGIPNEHQARVFDRFYRVDQGRSPGQGGAGLGLSISQAIIAAHGGRIGLISAPGHGTTVEIILPVELRPVNQSSVPAAIIRAPAAR